MNNHLHIISFDVPFPGNYGGVIDVFYKLVALKQQGIKIHLHCFTYGRKPAPELERYCESVSYYERKTGLAAMFSFLPYNVESRRSKQLEKNLLKDNNPILFEVLHTCYLLDDPRFKNRKKIHRHSNIEHDYYNELSRSERSLVKKVYLKIEAIKLKRFEKILNFADLILAVNKKDTDYFRKKFPAVKSEYLPSFHPNTSLNIQPGKGNFILFHGNLSVSENYEAADWLIRQVFSKFAYKCVIAGLNPPEFLKNLVEKYPNIDLIANPDAVEMSRLVQEAQIHTLFTAQPTGLKLKLLNVLFNGRFIICNTNMLEGTPISGNNTLHISDSAEAFIRQIDALMKKEFSDIFLEERKLLVSGFDNQVNCKKIVDLLG